MFRKMPFILLALILIFGVASPWIPLFYQSVLYGISLSVKSFIVFLLPFIVFGLLFKTAVHFSNQASKMILLILFAVCCSNFISTMLSYFVGDFVYTLDIAMTFPDESNALNPLWNISLPKWIANDHAMFGGLLSGIIFGRLNPSLAKTISVKCESVVNVLLQCILVVIPLLVTGSIIKMSYDEVMGDILRNYGLIFCVIGSAVFAYITFIYAAVNRFQGAKIFSSIKNMLPAAVAGFGTMSSAASMPLTILGTEKNSKNPDLAASVIPATVNIHLMGDCFAIPIFAFAVMKGFGLEAPSLADYLIFAGFFVLTKFSVAAVPGGGILVMMPVLEKYLGFDAQMLSLITALYILFDPVITCANIFGNGGLAMAVDRIFTRCALSKERSQILTSSVPKV